MQKLLDRLPLEERLTTCPICGNRAWDQFASQDIARCRKCGTLFRDPRPTQDVIAASYDRGHTYSRWHAEGESWPALWHRRVAYVKRFCASGNVLDIGVGDGSFLKMMHAAGFSVQGTELSNSGANFARDSGLEVRIGQFTDLPFDAESFDLITMWHVLEHVPNPQEVVRKIFQLLRPRGLFIVAVPNEAHALIRHRLMPKRFPRPFEDLVCGGEVHLTHFTPKTVKRFFRREGFKILWFGVDDFYPDRSPKARAKFWLQQMIARLTGWHPAVAMQMVCVKTRRH